jgi:hypothetical protein
VNDSIASLPRRLVRRHLDRLRASFDALHERLRDAIARVVGEAVAEAMREVVYLLMHLPVTTSPPSSSVGSFREDRKLSPLHDPYRRPWDDEDDENYPREVEATDHKYPVAACEVVSTPAQWSRAVALGCDAVSWWLRRQTHRFPALAALGLGVAVTVAAYAGGPVAAAGGAASLGAALGIWCLARGVDRSCLPVNRQPQTWSWVRGSR